MVWPLPPPQASTLFVTHLVQLTELSRLYPTVKNVHFEVCPASTQTGAGIQIYIQIYIQICFSAGVCPSFFVSVRFFTRSYLRLIADAQMVCAKIRSRFRSTFGFILSLLLFPPPLVETCLLFSFIHGFLNSSHFLVPLQGVYLLPLPPVIAELSPNKAPLIKSKPCAAQRVPHKISNPKF